MEIMNKLRGLFSMGILCTIFGCTGIEPQQYVDNQPQVDIKEFFTGDIKAWGIVQDRSGNVVNKFDVDMVGTWDGNEGVLDEDFVYYDGKEQKRIWKITKLENGKYKGTAGDIIGDADGETFGDMIVWNYEMEVPVDNTTYKLKFDDYMWAMNDGVIINRSYLKKFGFVVAELTLFIQKQ